MKRLLLCLLSACALHITVSAHVLDQYLQVAQIALAPDGARIELRLIPGVQVADRVFALIDADDDGQISAAEEQAYAQLVLQNLSLSINEKSVPLTITDTQFPTRQTMSEGLGTIRLTFTAAATLNGAGNQQLNFRNDHLPEFSVYLVNALVPASDVIKITGQERDTLQHGLQLNFQATPSATPERQQWIGLFLFGLCLALYFFTGRFGMRRNPKAKIVSANCRRLT